MSGRGTPPSVLALTVLSRGPALPALVAESISREIREHRLKPGDRLPTEQALATMFGVSRNVVREAMARLRSDGAVWSRQGSGFFVSDAAGANGLAAPSPSVSDAPPPSRRRDRPPASARAFRDLFEARTALEPVIAGLAAERRRREDLARLDAAVAGLATAPYGSRPWLDSDIAFHRALAKATRNVLLERSLEAVIGRIGDSLLAARVRPELASAALATIEEHRVVLAAVRARDAGAAGQAMRDHLAGATRRLGE